jgi:hypothetical protein
MDFVLFGLLLLAAALTVTIIVRHQRLRKTDADTPAASLSLRQSMNEAMHDYEASRASHARPEVFR